MNQTGRVATSRAHDEALVRRAAAGDETAFRQIADRYAGLIGFLARERYAPGMDRDDVDQEALLAFHLAVRDYRPASGASFRTFAAHVIRRRLVTLIIGANRQKHSPLNDRVSLDRPVASDDGDELTFAGVLPDPGLEPWEQLHERDRLHAVVDIVNRGLSRIERESVIGRIVGESYLETEARILAFDADRPGRATTTTVKVIDNALVRARRKIADALADLEQPAPLGAAA